MAEGYRRGPVKAALFMMQSLFSSNPSFYPLDILPKNPMYMLGPFSFGSF
jgi:hypothetical protein